MSATDTEPVAFDVLRHEQEIRIDAPRDDVFDVMTTKAGEWFPHRYIPGSSVTCEPWVGGRIYEDDGEGRGWLWTTCVAMLRPEVVSYQSPWGFAGDTVILVTYRLEADGDATIVRVTHKIMGAIPEEARAGYMHVLGGMKEQLTTYFGARARRA